MLIAECTDFRAKTSSCDSQNSSRLQLVPGGVTQHSHKEFTFHSFQCLPRRLPRCRNGCDHRQTGPSQTRYSQREPGLSLRRLLVLRQGRRWQALHAFPGTATADPRASPPNSGSGVASASAHSAIPRTLPGQGYCRAPLPLLVRTPARFSQLMREPFQIMLGQQDHIVAPVTQPGNRMVKTWSRK